MHPHLERTACRSCCPSCTTSHPAKEQQPRQRGTTEERCGRGLPPRQRGYPSQRNSDDAALPRTLVLLSGWAWTLFVPPPPAAPLSPSHIPPSSPWRATPLRRSRPHRRSCSEETARTC